MLSDLFWRYQKSKNLYWRRVINNDAKKAIIFLHGMGASRNYWGKSYDTLSTDFSLYFIDLLGFGFSSKPLGEYTISRHINAIRNFIRDEIGEPNISFVGHSLGAIIALAYAQKYPQNIEKLLLLSLPYYLSEKEARASIKSSRLFSFLFTDTPLAHISCMLMCYIRPIFRLLAPLFAKDLPRDIARDAFLHTHVSYFSTLRNVILKQNIPSLLDQSISSKIILLHGENDQTVPLGNIQELSNKYSLKLIPIVSGSHNLPLTSNEEVIKTIKKYI